LKIIENKTGCPRLKKNLEKELRKLREHIKRLSIQVRRMGKTARRENAALNHR
jgi:hypothetical protein